MFVSPRPAHVMSSSSGRAGGHMAVSRDQRGTQWTEIS